MEKPTVPYSKTAMCESEAERWNTAHRVLEDSGNLKARADVSEN
jgi:hypothetical protein